MLLVETLCIIKGGVANFHLDKWGSVRLLSRLIDPQRRFASLRVVYEMLIHTPTQMAAYMSYPRCIRESARRHWLLGLSDEQVMLRLKADFPDKATPSRVNTILKWRKAENWAADLEIIAEKVQKKRTEELADKLIAADEKAFAFLKRFDAHLNLLLQRVVRGDNAEIIDTKLTAGDLAHVASAFEKSVRTSRLIRGQSTTYVKTETVYKLKHSLMTDEEVDRMANGEDLEVVFSKDRLEELKVDL